MQNPFESIQSELKEIKVLVTQLLEPKDDLSQKMYTINEAAKIQRCSRQTIKNRINSGFIKASRKGKNGNYLIKHHELFNSLDEVKSLKYKRQA
ncbi:Helix-turn-helix domain-containing protein [Flavobacterium flevense]|uniref:DNA-binding protein n=1 Tax=Flavobacterium flevense TaxID=983 RepID=A0A4Y4AV92_9FLAO|nr:helix-turn-helix domain-containing protein [Flavobacterium flevense]GEC72148.1 DNA-binding protein [Flavobacterium flevense]SHL93912.1 Helix-turn-helix domain-containing protein [Flavobacterium flevense]